jgi:N-acetylneuraminic acid mutarotase
MKKQTDVAIKGHIIRGASYLLLLVAGTAMAFFGPEATTKVLPRTLSFAERVSYQRAIEDVYWRHCMWPKENPNPKPSLDAVMSQAQLEKKVENYLRNSAAVEDYYKEPLSAEQLQGEMERMGRHTKQPEVLRELFEALGNDPFVIAECLARPVLAERMITSLHMTQTKAGLSSANIIAAPSFSYALPTISEGANACIDDTWTATNTINAPSPRFLHTAVWTGSEMIVWGGTDLNNTFLNTGGRYNPSTDSWTVMSIANAPSGRDQHTAVWTGTEMIVWGGYFFDVGRHWLDTGGRYNPLADTWTATSTTNAPVVRADHTAVWTGSEMIVWGGINIPSGPFNTGGRYNPSTDSWTATSTANAPIARYIHTAVWSGNDMIIWGGANFSGIMRSGGRYHPSTDTWTATSITHAPTSRASHTAVWTGNEMVVWGGNGGPLGLLNTGGRYNPGTDGWASTSTTDAPEARQYHSAVWTGTEMIVWGGSANSYLDSGGRYNSSTDTWTAISTTDAPTARYYHTAAWSGTEMIVWGGTGGVPDPSNTGGRYCAQSGSPTPTPTPTPGPILLRGQGKKVGGINTSRLKWRGANSANVDVYRDGVVIATTPNDGLYDDSTGTTGQASFTYHVCEAGTSTCSNQVTVNFPP